MLRTIRRAPLALAVLSAGVLAVPGGAGAASTKTCKLSLRESRQLGPTYVQYAEGRPGYKVRGTSCANGEKVIEAFHACRLAKGEEGRCTRRVEGYRCSDERPADEAIPTQFTGHVSCRRGDRRVRHLYQQNT